RGAVAAFIVESVGGCVDLVQHGVVDVFPECGVHGFDVRAVAVRGQLERGGRPDRLADPGHSPDAADKASGTAITKDDIVSTPNNRQPARKTPPAPDRIRGKFDTLFV